MANIATTERPITVDLRLDCAVTLPHTVAREAEAAAAALVRLAPHPQGTPAWRQYHGRFLERYGIGALVPVTDIIDPDVGLGFPAGYRDSLLTAPVGPGLTDRDVALMTLAQTAAIEGRTEIVLDDTMIDDLEVTDSTTVRVQPHTELTVRVHAQTLDALTRGDFELAVTGVSRAAGTTTGRFLDLLDADDRDRMITAYAELPMANDSALAAQVSCRPLYVRAENVTRSPAVLPHVVSLGEHRSHDAAHIPLDDLAVTGDAQQLYLVSLSRHQTVEPRVFSAVEFTNHAHPLLRFLCEITTAHAAACAPFSWGAAHRLPFLPRLRYRQTILTPARWSLDATTLPGHTAAWKDWAERLADWRCRFRVPQRVYVGDGDRRILVDLVEPAHLHLLRADLDRTGHATLREAPPAALSGWIGGRAHEIVIPLASTAGPAPRKKLPAIVIGREHGHLPAEGDWLYVKLYGHPDRQTAILTTHVPRLMSTWDSAPQWWYLRYHDPDAHLRLRIRLRGADDPDQTIRRATRWIGDLRRLGLTGRVQIDTYYPETGRFGTGPAMTAAETLFAADSAATIAQLTLTSRHGAPHANAVTAAGLLDLAVSAAGDTTEGLRWLIDHISTRPAPRLPRTEHDAAIRLANPDTDQAGLHGLPGGADVAAAWARRRIALAAYRDILTDTGANTLESILPDLLHLHCVRVHGISPETERTCHRLARAAALSWTARHRGAT